MWCSLFPNFWYILDDDVVAGGVVAMLQGDAGDCDRWVRVSAGDGIELSDNGQCVRPAVFKLRKWKNQWHFYYNEARERHKEEKNHWLLWKSHGPDFSDSTVLMSLIPEKFFHSSMRVTVPAAGEKTRRKWRKRKKKKKKKKVEVGWVRKIKEVDISWAKLNHCCMIWSVWPIAFFG